MAHFITREAVAADVASIVALLPRLADYTLPPNRTSEMFWSSDAKLVKRWADGGEPDVFIRVAVDAESSDADQAVVGVAIVTIKPDHFSGEPNGHLEVLCVAPAADGSGTGKKLLAEAEVEAKARGAQTMSLHVLGNNQRARHVYESVGYDEEMIRAIKFL